MTKKLIAMMKSINIAYNLCLEDLASKISKRSIAKRAQSLLKKGLNLKVTCAKLIAYATRNIECCNLHKTKTLGNHFCLNENKFVDPCNGKHMRSLRKGQKSQQFKFLSRIRRK